MLERMRDDAGSKQKGLSHGAVPWHGCGALTEGPGLQSVE